MREVEIVDDPIRTLPFVQTIRSHADAERESLGFLPEEAYREAALQGKILVAIARAEGGGVGYAGHLMFGGRPPTLRVFQLLVLPAFRERGVGPALVARLVALAETNGFFSIIARVAEDLEAANAFWQKVHFRRSDVCTGGKSRARSIIVRERRLNTPSLFDLPVPSDDEADHDLCLRDIAFRRSAAYSIDLNVLLDLLQDRPRAAVVSRIVSAALVGSIRLFVAPEFIAELRRAKQTTLVRQDDTLLDFALSLPQHPSPPPAVMDILTLELSSLIFPEPTRKAKLKPRDQSDVRHLAVAIYNHVSGFITSEEAILRKRAILIQKLPKK